MAITVVDTGHAEGDGSGTTDSVSLTLSAGLTMLVVAYGSGEAANASGMTWNGVAMTSAISRTCTGACAAVWYLASPASGTHNLAWTLGNNIQAGAKYVTFSGSALTVGATNSDVNYTAPSCTVTTTGTGNGYVVDSVVTQANRADLLTVGAGQTDINTAWASTYYRGSYEAFAGGGNPSMDWTGATGGSAAHSAVEIDEAASGPANMKTADGLAAASVKTMNGLAIGSVKTVNGLA